MTTQSSNGGSFAMEFSTTSRGGHARFTGQQGAGESDAGLHAVALAHATSKSCTPSTPVEAFTDLSSLAYTAAATPTMIMTRSRTTWIVRSVRLAVAASTPTTTTERRTATLKESAGRTNFDHSEVRGERRTRRGEVLSVPTDSTLTVPRPSTASQRGS